MKEIHCYTQIFEERNFITNQNNYLYHELHVHQKKTQWINIFVFKFQSRQNLTSPESTLQAAKKFFSPNGSSTTGGSKQQVTSDIDVSSCATPPQHRRRLFNPKNLRSPFGQRRPAKNSVYSENNSTLSGKNFSSNCIKIYEEEYLTERMLGLTKFGRGIMGVLRAYSYHSKQFFFCVLFLEKYI